MKTVAIIPARYNSSRLPGKPLIDICGKSMIRRVWESVCESDKIDDIFVATDDERIVEHCKSFGANVIITPEDLPSGTDRIEFAYRQLNLCHDIIVNVQGDEVLINGKVLDELLFNFIPTKTDVGTLVTTIKNKSELFDNSVVKVVLHNDSTALYFSRNVIPFIRDIEPDNWIKTSTFMKHIGIYAYRKESLKRFVSLEQSSLEKAEKLEQLRLLQAGASYLCIPTDAELIGVDTKGDILKVEEILEKRKI